MRRRTLAFGLAATAALVAAPHAAQSGMTAKAEIKGDKISGTAQFREIDAQTAGAHDMKFMTGMKAVEITVKVSGLTPGPHGVHLHAVGRCEAPFTSAGGHFDPGPRGESDPDVNHPYHMGDLPNLVADAKGEATMTAITTRVTLSAGPLSLFDDDGTAIIVHGNPDQGRSGAAKSGVSGGPRVACGVVQK